MAQGQKLSDIESEQNRLLRDSAQQLQTIIERERDGFKCAGEELRTKLEGTEDSLSQPLAELESTKKNSKEVGYKKGFNAANAHYVAQMLSIQDQILVTAWEACLTKAGVADDSPLWVENDLPST